MNFSRFLNFKSIVFGIGIFAIIIAILGFSGRLPIFNTSSKQKLTGNLNVWGTIPKSAMSTFVDLFDKEAKTYTMNYTEVPHDEMNSKLINAIADGVAPDLIISPSDIVFANQKRFYPISFSSISESDFKNIFVDSANILIDNNSYIALPISVDPLILYYNRDILSTNGYTYPPNTWGDFYNYSQKITKLDSNNNLSLSTIAFGTYDNIPHISDIILSMIFQQGQIPVSKNYIADSLGNYTVKYTINTDQIDTNTGISSLNSVLAFSKDFADRQKAIYTWDIGLDNALNEFISGNLAFYIGPVSEASYIKSANQKLYFDYALLPQVSGSNISATFGNLYTIGMLRTSQNQNLAYQVMIALATGVFSQNLVSLTGGVSALKSNIAANISSGDHSAQVFGNSALISKSFYDLHRKDLESLMREAIREIYNGEKSTVEASKLFSDNLQNVYDEKN